MTKNRDKIVIFQKNLIFFAMSPTPTVNQTSNHYAVGLGDISHAICKVKLGP